MIMPIKDYDGYFVSDLGIVYSNLGKGNRNKDKTVAMYAIKPRLTKNYTENNNHVVRNKLGRFVSNFNYSINKCE